MDLLNDPKFIGGIAGGTVLVLLLLAAHVKACFLCCRHRRPQLPPLISEQKEPKGSDPEHGGVDTDGRKTPSINEKEPLLGGSLHSIDTVSAWNLPLVYEGWFVPIHRSRIPALPEDFKSQNVSDDVQKIWKRQKGNAPGEYRGILQSTMWEYLRGYIALGSLIAVIQGALSAAARPYVLRLIINEIAGGTVAMDEAILLIVILAVIVFFEGVLGVLYRHIISNLMGTRFLGGLFALIVDKVVCGFDSSNKNIDVTNLIGNDATRRFMDLMLASDFPMAVGAIVGGVVMIFLFLGWQASLAGIITMILILAINIRIAHIVGDVEKNNLRVADSRIKTLMEIVNSIKAVKFFAWEQSYLEKISDIRLEECKSIRKYRTLQVVTIALGRACPSLAAAAAVVTYSFVEDKLAPGDIFASVSVFQALRIVLIILPHSLTSLANIRTSMVRIDEFLALPGRNRREPVASLDNVLSLQNVDIGTSAEPAAVQSIESALALLQSFDILSSHEFDEFSRRAESAICENIIVRGVNIELKRGQITAIVGSVGAGKSAIISTIIGELDPIRGNIESLQDIGYVPQQPVIISGSILDNILLGRQYVKDMMDRVLEAADLGQDVRSLPQGLATEIGERGTMLSGGQQQRLSIARALYGSPALLVLDDPLSAVDPEVCRRIFDRAVLGFSKGGGAVLMVVNQLHLLSDCNHILFLEKGQVLESGSYSQLVADGGEFSKLIGQHVFAADEESSTHGRESVHVAEHTHVAKSDARGELVKMGAIETSVYMDYIKSMGWVLFSGTILAIIAGYMSMAFMDIWLAMWVEESDGVTPMKYAEEVYPIVFGASTATFSILMMTGSVLFAYGGYRASKLIHFRCVSRMLHAPYSWFQDTPTGRITSRFTTDLGFVDLQLSFWIDNVAQLFTQFLAMCAVMAYILPMTVIPVALASAVYWFASVAVNRTNREIKREANQAMGPVQSNVTEGMRAASVAKIMKCESFFIRKHHQWTDDFNRANFISSSLKSWMQLVSVYASFIISISIGAYIVAIRSDESPERLALVLMYSFILPYFLSSLAHSFTNLKVWFTSLERVRELEVIPQEPSFVLDNDIHLSNQWPQSGALNLSNVELQYKRGAPPVLKGVSVAIKKGESIGVVGRTGAGKSSLMSVIFRLVDSTGGSIELDGVNIKDVGLHKLRSGIGIIPQEPILMNGTVRYNLDPFELHSDDEIRSALSKANLPGGLMYNDVSADGSGLSVGQRQLLCFARAILQKAPLLLMDEPTANCDMETDQIIQEMVRKEFADTTIVTIAHRLNTIIDYDKILVMGDGRVLEFGTPSELLARMDGNLARMVSAMGKGAEAALQDKANRHNSSIR